MSLETGTGILAVILLAYFMFGVSGFGSSLIAVPLLSHFLPLRSAVMLALVLDLISAIGLSRKERHHVRWDELKSLIPFSLLGILAGAAMLSRVPSGPLLFTLGIFVILVGIRYLLLEPGKGTVSQRWAALAGLSGGTASALFGTGGPSYMSYLVHRLENRSELRATFSGLLALDGGLRVTVFIASGLFFSSLDLTLLAIALPAMVLGLYLGHRAHTALSNQQMKRLTAVLLLGSGLSLLLRNM